ncbi:MAG: hypothetical protein U0840_26985 [Gemmataceae bacterium]
MLPHNLLDWTVAYHRLAPMLAGWPGLAIHTLLVNQLAVASQYQAQGYIDGIGLGANSVGPGCLVVLVMKVSN